MLRGVYPGSFDPITYGHMDIIKRSSRLVDELIVGVLHNKSKSPLFSVDERVKMLEEVTKNITNIKIVSFEGLVVNFAKEYKAKVMIRGLRAITDFDYELQMSQTNHQLNENIETIFLTTSLEHSYISSSMTKEVYSFGGDISKFVPPIVVENIKDKIRDN